MKKENTYVPQFDYDDITKEEFKKCIDCGAETLVLYDGLCFDCKKEIGFSQSEIDNSCFPNWDLYNKRIEENIESLTTPFAFGLIWKPLRKYGITLILCSFAFGLFITSIEYKSLSFSLFSVFLFIVGICISIFRKKLRYKKFCKFNKMTIEFWESHGWTCPCCSEVNYSLNYCKVCGVRPNLFITKNKE